MLNLRHRSNSWVYRCSEAEWWSVSGDWSTTGQWLCCRLWRTMLLRYACRVGHVLVLVLCLSSAEDFDWTKNDHGSFYYGTFPAGKDLFPLTLTTNGGIKRKPRKKMISLIRIFVGCRQFSLSDRRSLGQRWKRSEHLGCVQSQERQSPTQWHRRCCLWGLLQSQGEGDKMSSEFQEEQRDNRNPKYFTLCCVCNRMMFL